MRFAETLVYLIKRLIMAIFVLVLISLIIFVAVRLTPGDPVLNKIGPYGDTSQENYQRVATELGLEKPMPVQYFIWLKSVIRLELGVSMRNGVSIGDTIIEKLPISFELILVALAFAIIVSVPLGMLSAIHKGGIVDQIIGVLTSSFLAMPAFCVGLLMIMLFSVKLSWFPSNGYTPFSENPAMNLKQLFMPALTLGLYESAVICKHVRSQTLDVVGANYIRTAKAKGLPRKYIYYKHVLKNILLTIITVVGTEFSSLFGGTVICEQVFGWSGIGWYIYQSISNRDYPAVQASVLVVAVIFVIVNLFMDFLYTQVDPRVKLS